MYRTALEQTIARLREPSSSVAIGPALAFAGRKVAPEAIQAWIDLASLGCAIAGYWLPERGRSSRPPVA